MADGALQHPRAKRPYSIGAAVVSFSARPPRPLVDRWGLKRDGEDSEAGTHLGLLIPHAPLVSPNTAGNRGGGAP